MDAAPFLFDMIHHNPGDTPMDSAFLDPAHLKAYGYQGQAFKHINTVVTFAKLAPGVFPATPEESQWLAKTRDRIHQEIEDAKAQGLSVYYHIDLFVLPQRIVDHFAERLTDPRTGRISLDQPFTLELHRVLLDEIFSEFPKVDGLIIRVGETYLFDTPFHTGNGAVHYALDNPEDNKIRHFVQLLQFLRAEVCVKHERLLIHRTWDTWPTRFHASLDFYLKVTNQIPPHPRLLFSVKHTIVDFHRWVAFNPCLMQGQHRQVVEVQCQREYEGKGAYPNYPVHGVIHGFSEQQPRRGLQEIVDHPLFAGIYTWSRGGGWFGPEVTRENELWCDLNAYVIAHWARNPARPEAEIFMDYAQKELSMLPADAQRFRRIALISLDAVLKGKCCARYDQRPKEQPGYPTNQWMRDDVLHGMEKLEHPFQYLLEVNGVQDALTEKAESVACWREMRAICDTISLETPAAVREQLTTSVEYGLRLFTAIEAAWRALLTGYEMEHGRAVLPDTLATALSDFDRAWAHYEALPSEYPRCATLYRPKGWAWPGKALPPGLSGAINHCRTLCPTLV